MARPLRIEFNGAVYHITSRGNEKKAIFNDNKDRLIFLKILYKVKKEFNWLCHAYCLMNNHYHLVIETPDGNLSRGMRQLNGIYTQKFNKKYDRVGHLFQGRYKAILIEKDSHLLEVCRYVVLNPVRAGLVRKPEQWQWSSYGAMAGISKPHPCLTVEWIQLQFGKRLGEAQNRYMEFVNAGIEEKNIWESVKGQLILGSEIFAEKITRYLRDKKQIKEIPRIQRYLGRPSLDDLFSGTALKNKAQRDKRIYEAVMKYGYSRSEVAKATNLHYSWVSRIVEKKVKKAKSKT